MNRKIIFAPGEFYHIYSRGVEKRKIFLDEIDRKRFLALMFFCNDTKKVVMRDIFNKDFSFRKFKDHKRKTVVDIGVYCLMPNHFHFLIREKIDNGISIFMQRLLTAYTMYFNKKNERNGPLFSSRFQAHHADSDEYLKHLYSYIHTNPVKIFQHDWKDVGINDMNEAKIFLNKYTYSSYIDYIGIEREQANILNTSVFPEYFEMTTIFSKMIEDSINYYNTYL